MKKILTAFAALAILAFAGCDDDTDLSEVELRLDDLEERMSTYEADIQGINDDIYALQTLVGNSGSISISSVTESDGIYTLVLSNGQTITINQNATSEVVMPEISINADGYWTVNGEVLTVDGNPVPASGDAGETPVIGVDADGYWTVTYGDTTEQILDASGNPIKATSDAVEADSFFDSVTIENGYLVIVLKDGTTSYSIPIVEGFQCYIGATGTQYFTAGETQTFTVTQTNVASAIVVAPAGWSATLSETELSVTAPADEAATAQASVETKATADSDKDVSIIAVSTTGFTAVAKIQVEISDGSETTVTPTATVEAGEVTSSSVSFTIALTDANTYYYVLISGDTAAPTTSDEMLAGTSSTETTLTISDLTAETAYTLYVMPVNGSTYGEIVSASATTSAAAAVEYASLHEQFAAEGLTIAGVTYTSSDYTAQTLTASTADIALDSYLGTSGIYFLKSEGDYKFTISAVSNVTADIILVGDDPDALTTIQPAVNNHKFNSGSLVMHNINLDMSLLSGQLFNMVNSTTNVSKFHIDACTVSGLKTALLFVGGQFTHVIESIKIIDSTIEMTAGVTMFNFANTTNIAGINEIVIDNNIIYNSSSAATLDMVRFNNAQTGGNPNVQFTNNTLVNCPSSNGYLKLQSIGTGSLNYSNNIFYCDPSYTSTVVSYLLFIVNTEEDFTTNHTVENNIVYGMGEDAGWYTFNGSGAVPTTEGFNNAMTKETSSPIDTTYPFTQASGYESYGAQR